MKKLLLFLLISTAGFSQAIYRGNVSDKDGPIPGAVICVLNSKRCVTSNFEGDYSIEVKVGDQLKIACIGMRPKIITITKNKVLENDDRVNPIISNDYTEKLKKSDNPAIPSMSSGTYMFDIVENSGSNELKKISRDKTTGLYNTKYRSQYHKMSLELNHDFSFSTPMRLPKYQTAYSQGRSLNGGLTYQSPETNETLSWGANLNTLAYSATPTEYYPQGNIVNTGSGNQTPLQLYNPNSFYQNAEDHKYSVIAQIEGPKGNFLKINFGYKTGNISIPTSRNNEITAAAKYFRKVSESSKIEAILSYNDFQNNLSNANFGVNKIVFANAVTPVHFDNEFASTLSNGFQRSFSAYENNPYYLMQHNLDQNKSKTLSLNFNHNYSGSYDSNIVNASFQSSDIKNENGQYFYFAGIDAPNFDRRIEAFKNASVSETFRHTFSYMRFIESKIDFRFQNRNLQRNYFTGFTAPSDVPGNSLTQDKLNIEQKRAEVFYNLNGSYVFRNVLNTYSEVGLKASSNLNYSSTVKNDFLLNYLVAVEIGRIFDRQINFSISHGFTEVEPSLQNNNLNFNSLNYQVSQFKELKNSLELITPKNAIATQEDITELSLLYTLEYYWNLNLNYYHKNVQNLYVPVFSGNVANWSPEVNYKQNGVEFEISKGLNFNTSRLAYGFNLNFTHYKNKVTSLNHNQTRIPFAGFADVNKNYITGQPLGVIVGNGYLRDNNQNKVIDADGFPMIDPQAKILGNSNPDFVVGFFNTFYYRNFTLNLSFDWSKGGKIWNGTQQTLNYYGRSELTAEQRNVTNYVFNGVTQSGTANTKAVSFYDANLPVEQNRWVRYGAAGVAEDAIEDASYFRLNAINLSYSTRSRFFNDKLNFTISVFMNNAFIVAKSKSAFSNNTMFSSADTSGLDYFNSPMMKSFGSSLTIKF